MTCLHMYGKPQLACRSVHCHSQSVMFTLCLAVGSFVEIFVVNLNSFQQDLHSENSGIHILSPVFCQHYCT